MDPSEIPKHEIKEFFSQEVKTLRGNAPQLLISLIKDGILENIESLTDIPFESVTALESGISSACYFLENNGNPIVIKFRTWGINAEAQSLKVWKEVGANVPQVIAFGVTDIEIGTERPIKYIILQGIVNGDGRPTDTGDKFLSSHPDQLEELGIEMGYQLFLLHQAKSEDRFGSYGDAGKFPQVESWNQHLITIIQESHEYLISLGLIEEQYEKMLQKISLTKFPVQGSFLHNDFGPKNILIASTQPLEIKVFDPDPLIGDPYWDIAHTLLRLEFHKAMVMKDKPNGVIPDNLQKEQRLVDNLINSYFKQSGQQLDRDRLLANLIGITIIKNSYAEKRNISNELEVRREILKDYIEQFSQ